MRYHRCKKCGRFIAEVRGDNDITLMGKIIVMGNKFVVECKCKEIFEIKVANMKKKYNYKI